MAENLPSPSIRSAVIRELGEGAVDLSADIERYRKIVLREIARFHQWSWLDNVPITLTTDSGQTYITIPDYINQIKNIFQAGGSEEIEIVGATEYARLAALDSGAQDYPSKAFIENGRLYFWPPLTSGDSVTVFANISGEQLDDDSDEGISGVASTIPQSYAPILESGILGYLDSIDNKMKWMTITHQKLLQAKAEDVKNKAHRIKPVIDKNIDGFRYYYNA
jgi:hypothetical protein